LFDAVVLLLSDAGAQDLLSEAAARDFVADAFSHCKYIAFTPQSAPLLLRAGVDPDADAGMRAITDKPSVEDFLETCRNHRFWSREDAVRSAPGATGQ